MVRMNWKKRYDNKINIGDHVTFIKDKVIGSGDYLVTDIRSDNTLNIYLQGYGWYTSKNFTKVGK